MGVLLPETEEEQRRKTITWLGSALILGFIFPILTSILNRNDFLASSIREYNKETTIMFLVILSLIGMYVGSKIVSVTDHPSGRSIGGVSGIVFLILVLLPVTGGTPAYFGLFSLLKTLARMKMPGSMMLLGVALIAIFTCYIFAAVINILNFSCRPNSQQTAANSSKMIFYSTLAIPISILVGVLLIGGGVGFGMIFMALVKICLVLGGIIGTIVMGLLDLIDQYLPRTVKGGDLLKSV